MYFDIIYIIVALYAITIEEVLGLRCKDRLLLGKCSLLKKRYVCNTHSHRMKTQCPKTCKLCDPTCHDKSQLCFFFVNSGACYRNQLQMEEFCPYSCNFCKVVNPCDALKCSQHQKCYLDSNNRPYCRCHVHQCRQKLRTGPLCTTTGQTFPNLCEMLKERCRTGRMIYVDSYRPCKRQIEKETVCKDASRESQNGLCAKWKEYGLCEKVRKMMENYCPDSCGFCANEIKAAKTRVPSPPKTCASKRFGCCWNDIGKPALGPNGEGCRACQDLKFCRRFRMNCGDEHNRNFMKQWCPNNCGYCYNNGIRVNLKYYRGAIPNE